MRYRGKHHSDTTKTSATEILSFFFFCSVMSGDPFILLQRGPSVRTKESTKARRFYETLRTTFGGALEKHGFFSKNAVREMAKQRPCVQSSQHSETASHRHTHTDTQGVAVAAKSRFLRFVSFLNLRKTHQHTVRQRASDAPLRRQHNTLTKKKKMLKLKRRRRRLYSASRTAGLGDGLRMAGSYLGLP